MLNQTQKFFVALGVSSLFSLLLSIGRIYIAGDVWYLFLVWNLFLAWIPFGCAMALTVVSQKNNPSKIYLGILLFIWFIFFPNAPYIITDLFHLRIIQHVPIWYDVVMIFSYVWNGLLLGFLSLLEVQKFLEKYLSKVYVWPVVNGVLLLAGFGIYLGRYLRWNSWDVISNPVALLTDIADRLVNPFSHPRTYTMTLVYAVFLMISYTTFKILITYHQPTKKK
jgi:uncharacterized membrane protein